MPDGGVTYARWRRESCQMDAQAETWGVPDGGVSGEWCVLVVMPTTVANAGHETELL